MDYEFRVVVEKVAVASQKVIKRDTLKIYDIKQPKSILNLGLRHEEQISLLSKVQNALLAEQSPLIDVCVQGGNWLNDTSALGIKTGLTFAEPSNSQIPIAGTG